MRFAYVACDRRLVGIRVRPCWSRKGGTYTHTLAHSSTSEHLRAWKIVSRSLPEYYTTY